MLNQNAQKIMHVGNIKSLSFAHLDKLKINNPDNFVIGVFNNTLRLPLNDNSLIILSNTTLSAVYSKIAAYKNIDFNFNYNELNNNYLKYYMSGDHAYVEFKSQITSQEDNDPHHKYYDLLDKLNKNVETPEDIKNDTQPLHFPLSDSQAQRALSVFSKFEKLGEAGQYKYVDVIHNCISLITDVHNHMNFSQHYTNFLSEKYFYFGIKPYALVHKHIHLKMSITPTGLKLVSLFKV